MVCEKQKKHISKSGYTFLRVAQKYTKYKNFTGLYFPTVYNVLQPNFTILLNLGCAFEMC